MSDLRSSLVLLAWVLSACTASHASDDAPSEDAGLDSAVDAAPPLPDADPCGTIGVACDDGATCDEGQMCFTVPADVDAGATALCVPQPRGSCGWGGPCPDPSDECHENTLMTDTGTCFEPFEFQCLCRRSPEFRSIYYDCPE